MAIDLLVSDKNLLLQFIKNKKWARTSEVISWGVKNYSNRADRNARVLAEEGKIRRMTKEEKEYHFCDIGEDVWVYVGDKNNG